MDVPETYEGFVAEWDQNAATLLAPYVAGTASFVPNLLPELAVSLSTESTLAMLEQRLGSRVAVALDIANTDPETPASGLPGEIGSPVVHHPDGGWLKGANLVGINVRTIGTFFSVVKYLLTVPAAVDAVHLLPIWEPGVVESLYGMASWRLNDEFFDPELAAAVPHLDTTESQLRAVVNLVHASGRTIGMDVIPHTDRYSEMALAQPHFFEWLRRQDVSITDHRDRLHEEVQGEIVRWLEQAGPAAGAPAYPVDPAEFFGDHFTEAQRLATLFGPIEDRIGRNRRRGNLVGHLLACGYEPVPATMGTPFRGIDVDETSSVIDEDGNVWRDYLITRPEPFSRVFNPLARYKLYGRHDDNRDWRINFSRPRREVFGYVAGHYADVQARFGFDFMRGDMSHVQMRPAGVPVDLDEHYDILGYVKNEIRQRNNAPFFGYFAESFLPPRDVFGYGEELDHLEAADAEVTQGDLQNNPVGSADFMLQLRQYLDIAATRACSPSLAVMTPDKDDPRFDGLYQKGNVVRTFVALFFTDLPSYVALGHETRDVHVTPWANEHYTKLFVFRERGENNVYPSKARIGDRFLWGRNAPLFAALTRLRHVADAILPSIAGRQTRLVLPPDPRLYRSEIAWTQAEHPEYVFVVNLDTEQPVDYFALPAIAGVEPGASLQLSYSTEEEVSQADHRPPWNGKHYRISGLKPEEARVYRIGSPVT